MLAPENAALYTNYTNLSTTVQVDPTMIEESIRNDTIFQEHDNPSNSIIPKCQNEPVREYSKFWAEHNLPFE